MYKGAAFKKEKNKIFLKKGLQNGALVCIIVMQTKYRGVEQLVARRAHNPKVVGSSPASATKSDTAIDTIVSIAVSLFYREKHRQNKHS